MSLFRKNGYSRSPPYPPAMNQLQHSSCRPLAAQSLRPSKEQSSPLGLSIDQQQSPSQAKKVSSQQAKPPSSQKQQSSSSQKAVKQQTPSAKQQQPPSARTPSAKQKQPPSAKTPSAKQNQSSDSLERQKGQPGNQLQQKLLASPQASTKYPSSQKQVTPQKSKKQSQQASNSTSHLIGRSIQQSSTTLQQKKQSSKEGTCPWKPLPPVNAISLKSTVSTIKSPEVVRESNLPENPISQKPRNTRNTSVASFLSDKQRAAIERLSHQSKDRKGILI